MENRRLGRGLDSLIGNGENGANGSQLEVSVAEIRQNPSQPRKSFDEDELESLCSSLKSHGILQPLVVRRTQEGYQLIAGERRLRAAQKAGMASVPVRVVDFNDQQVLEAALAENIQRSDLNAIEKAQGFKEYLDRFGVGHDDLAKRLGLARPTITNLVNLLELEQEVQNGLRVNQISEGHAKALKGLKDPHQQVAAFRQVVARGLSVKATEAFVREMKEDDETVEPTPKSTKSEPATEKTSHVKGIEDQLRQRFATPVEIKLKAKDKGQIILNFETNDDFMRIVEGLNLDL